MATTTCAFVLMATLSNLIFLNTTHMLSPTKQTLIDNGGVRHGMTAVIRRMTDGRCLVMGTISADAIPANCIDVVGCMSLEIVSLRDATQELKGVSVLTIVQEGVKLEH